VLRVVIFGAVQKEIPITLADVEKALLNAPLQEDQDNGIILIRPPVGRKTGFWKIQKAVYGLGDAPLMWYKTLTGALMEKGWKKLVLDPCVFTRNGGEEIMAIHVDDLLLATEQGGESVTELGFALGKVRKADGAKFVGQMMHQGTNGWLLSQKHYVSGLQSTWKRGVFAPLPLTLPTMEEMVATPLMERDVRRFRRALGQVAWVANTTRPDVAFAANFLAKFMKAPTVKALEMVERCKKYLLDTIELALPVYRLDMAKTVLVGHPDATWAAERDEFKSQTGYVITLEDGQHTNVLTWRSAIQRKVARSSMSAEMYANEACVVHMKYLALLLGKVAGSTPSMGLLTDSEDAYAVLVEKSRSLPKEKGILVSVAYVRDMVSQSCIDIKLIPGTENVGDELTKLTKVGRLQNFLVKHESCVEQNLPLCQVLFNQDFGGV